MAHCSFSFDFLVCFVQKQKNSQHQKVAETPVSAAILCPAVCINDVISQVVMCVKSVRYVTSQPFIVLHW